MAVSLKEMAKGLGLPIEGNKRVLFDRILHSGSEFVEMVDGNSFKFRFWSAKQPENSVPIWVILTPQEVAPTDGMNMATGAQEAFYGPTNQENSEGGQRSNFLSSQSRELSIPNMPKGSSDDKKGGRY